MADPFAFPEIIHPSIRALASPARPGDPARRGPVDPSPRNHGREGEREEEGNIRLVAE